jgi:hypothetical protein
MPIATSYRPASDNACFSHPFVTRVEHHVGKLLAERSRHETLQFLVELHGYGRHAARTETVAAEFLGDGAHFARRDALHIHLGQRQQQGLFAALVARKHLGAKEPSAVLRHA